MRAIVAEHGRLDCLVNNAGWDKMTPFYQHLQGPPILGPGYTVDRVGVAATIGIGAAFATHGVISFIKRSREHAAREGHADARLRVDSVVGTT